MIAILFSALTNVPVSQTFAAGMIPGIILLFLMIAVVLFKCSDIKGSKKATGYERIIAGKNAIPALITPGIILGGIYAGLLTPSESAAIAGLWALIMGFIVYRELTLDGLLKCLKETAAITAVIFAIIATATFLSVVLTYTQLPQKIITYFTSLGAGIYFFWFALALICLILGTFIEIVPVFYLTVPIFAAIVVSLNQNLLHLYVVFVAFAGIGMITMSFYIQITFLIVCLMFGVTVGDGKFSGGSDPSLEFLFRAWSWPSSNHYLILILIGASSAFGGFFISQAYRISEAAVGLPDWSLIFISCPLNSFSTFTPKGRDELPK